MFNLEKFKYFDYVPFPVMVIDKECNVLFSNEKAYETYGKNVGKCYEISHKSKDPCFFHKDHPCPLREIIDNNLSTSVSVHKHSTSKEDKYFYVTVSKIEDYFIEMQIDVSYFFKEYGLDKIQLDMLFSEGNTSVFLWKNEPGWPVEYVSNSVLSLTGYTPQEFISGKIKYIDIIHPDDIKKVMEEVTKYSKSNVKVFTHEIYRIVKKDKKIVNVLDQTHPIYDRYGNITHYYGVITDTTNEIRYERLYNSLRKLNRSITTYMNEEELYKEVCEVIKEGLGAKFVWVGLPDEKKKCFKAVYKLGEDGGYLDAINIKIGDHLSEAKGPTSRAYTEREIVINSNTETNEKVAPWKEEMLKRGFLSSAAVPVIKHGKVVAVVNIYASEPYFFEERNITLLEELKHDISFAVEKNEQVRYSMLLQKAIDLSNQWVVITDENGIIEYVNNFVLHLTGYEGEELIGKSVEIFESGYHSKEFYNNLWNTIRDNKKFEAIFVNRKKSGETFYVEEILIPLYLEKHEKKILSLGRDITKETILSKENERLRYFDALTDVYNLNGFFLRVQDELRNRKNYAALAVIDIQGLAFTNNSYGVQAGDGVLKSVAEELKIAVRDRDIIGRTGDDEFAILFLDLKSRDNAIIIENKIKQLFGKLFNINGNEIRIAINGGMAIFPDDANDFSTLYNNAVLALKAAKKEKQQFVFFNNQIEKKAREFVSMEELIEKSIRHNYFLFHYQPYFNTKDLSIAGAEALVRIKDENGKFYYPKEFIDVLEHSPYLEKFTELILSEVAARSKEWGIPIGINISANTFKNKDFPEKVNKFISDIKNYLIIEITERIFIGDIEKCKKTISDLKIDRKIKISIDDFGTGYSSLSYLKDLHADILKIDISFIKAMVEDSRSKALVQSIIHIGKALGMKTVAEGVETEEQLKILKEFEVDYVQGFFLSRPIPKEALEKLLLVNM